MVHWAIEWVKATFFFSCSPDVPALKAKWLITYNLVLWLLTSYLGSNVFISFSLRNLWYMFASAGGIGFERFHHFSYYFHLFQVHLELSSIDFIIETKRAGWCETWMYAIDKRKKKMRWCTRVRRKGTNVLNQRREKYNPYTTNNRSSKAGMNF
jgi:hypothetical protein